jgi:predicted O-linked N-acetylglucosamine transferase (SPINDLY family)
MYPLKFDEGVRTQCNITGDLLIYASLNQSWKICVKIIDNQLNSLTILYNKYANFVI